MKWQHTVQIFCGIGLFISFFLPWGKFFFFTGSGYDINPAKK